MRNAPGGVLHIVHPRPVEWNVLFEPIAKVLNIPMVGYSEWLSSLNKAAEGNASEKDLKENPALKLVDFFRTFPTSTLSEPSSSASSGADEAMGLKRLALNESLKVSEALRACPKLSAEDAQKWLVCWKLVCK